MLRGSSSLALAVLITFQVGHGLAAKADDSSPGPWPSITRQTKPWAYWWWMGSAVDKTNLTRELERYRLAGMGGVHIIPIYGAKGYEDKFIEYLSSKWMEMLHYTVQEAERSGLGVDMTTGTGWCFGGPRVTDEQANATVVCRCFDVSADKPISEKLGPKDLQALMAFPAQGQGVDLIKKVRVDGTLDWSPPDGSWRVFAISQRPSGQKVKRASPGGQGHMLNLAYPEAMEQYLAWFDEAFKQHPGPKPRAMYHDSYEYRTDWAPDFFTAFQKRRGYRLENELPALFSSYRARGSAPVPTAPDEDRVARVKSDYRETISDVMAEESLPLWAAWSRKAGFITRNEAHGSPGNWLDLYAAADVPETEMFHLDRSKLVSKFASSAAHVTGRPLVAAETGTWLAEHFTETLADMKFLLDDLFLSGVNHVFYHGTCYSPDQAPWPGWLFYASYEMNPRNSIWRDVPALNAYATRCQSVLQAGRPDNDLLVYWPIYDLWHNPTGMVRNLTVHGRDWLEEQPLGKTADQLLTRGYSFDYISDRLIQAAQVQSGQIKVPGGTYRAIVIPPTEKIPLPTIRQLLAVAEGGATIICEDRLPQDVPGWGRLAERRGEFRALLDQLKFGPGGKFKTAQVGRGRILVGNLEEALSASGISREEMFDRKGLMCLRRSDAAGWFYFVANRSEQPVEGWVPFARKARHAIVMDPLTGTSGVARARARTPNGGEVFLSLPPGASLMLKFQDEAPKDVPEWRHWVTAGPPGELKGNWEGKFLAGGPQLPAPFKILNLSSWTALADTNAQRFAGTAVYRVSFAAPGAAEHWWLDLGRVCQSARVRLNGQELGTLFTPPFRVLATSLKPRDNVLEVEVTNTSANRVRDLDRRGVNWKNFYDINFVGIDYKPFDASKWPLSESGLLGPVTLTPVKPAGL